MTADSAMMPLLTTEPASQIHQEQYHMMEVLLYVQCISELAAVCSPHVAPNVYSVSAAKYLG
jgi:hypothetical protein